MEDDLKIIEPPECPSEEACVIVNSFLDDSPTQSDYEIRILNIKQSIIDNKHLMEETKIRLNSLIEEDIKLREMLYNNYNEVWQLYGRYKHEVTSL